MRQPPAKPTLPILAELPPGYFVEEAPGGVMAVSIGYARALHEIGYGPESDGELGTSDLHGRRPMFEFELADERLVLRRFHHGGLLRWATGQRFMDAERPFRELILADALARSGIATPEVVAARARLARGGGWYLDLVTRRIEGSSDLGAVLEKMRTGEYGAGVRGAVSEALGKLLRKLHGFGLLHADLQPRNLLLSDNELAAIEAEGEAKTGLPVIWVIDLDRSAFVGNLSEIERRANLRRLYRALDRRDRRGGRFMHRSDFARFFKAYDPSGERWKGDWRQILSTHHRAGPAHWLGQVFERGFGGHGGRRHDG